MSKVKTLVDHLASYAAYHRDQRNIILHFIGIPPIVLGVIILLSRPAVSLSGIPITPALVIALLATLFYLRLHIGMGLVLGILFLLGCDFGYLISQFSTGDWLKWGLSLFIGGWFVQFIGHYFEGKKPAFVDDIIGLLQGPIFLVAEALFLLGWGKGIKAEIEQRVGPVHV